MKLKCILVLLSLMLVPRPSAGDVETSNPEIGFNFDLPLSYEIGHKNVSLRGNIGPQARLSLGHNQYDRTSIGLFIAVEGRLYTSAEKRRFYFGYVASAGTYYGITVRFPQTFGNVNSYMHGPRIGLTLPRSKVDLCGGTGVWIIDIYMQVENVTHLDVVLRETAEDFNEYLFVFGISAGIGFGRNTE